MLSPQSKFMLWSRCEWLLVPSSPVLLFCPQDSGTLPVQWSCWWTWTAMPLFASNLLTACLCSATKTMQPYICFLIIWIDSFGYHYNVNRIRALIWAPSLSRPSFTLADVISIYELLTNLILLFHFDGNTCKLRFQLSELCWWEVI